MANENVRPRNPWFVFWKKLARNRVLTTYRIIIERKRHMNEQERKEYINWLKLDDLLDENDYIATDKEVKQAFKNRGFINLKGNKSHDHPRP